MLAALVLAAQPAAAQQRGDDRGRRDDAGARIRDVERSGGRVLGAEPMQRGGREVYRIKVLTPEGRVRVISADDDRGAPRRPDLTDRRRDPRNDPGFEPPRERADLRERTRHQPRERDDRRGRTGRGDGDGGGIGGRGRRDE